MEENYQVSRQHLMVQHEETRRRLKWTRHRETQNSALAMRQSVSVSHNYWWPKKDNHVHPDTTQRIGIHSTKRCQRDKWPCSPMNSEGQTQLNTYNLEQDNVNATKLMCLLMTSDVPRRPRIQTTRRQWHEPIMFSNAKSHLTIRHLPLLPGRGGGGGGPGGWMKEE